MKLDREFIPEKFVIWKYPIPTNVDGKFMLELDPKAMLIKVDVQDDRPTMWFVVNPDAEKIKRFFQMVGTGIEIDGPTMHESSIFVDTFFSGKFVWHIFQLKDKDVSLFYERKKEDEKS